MVRTAACAIVLLGVLGFVVTDADARGSANAQTRATLDRQLPAVNFTNVALKDAIDFLRDVSGANVHVNWKALEAAGITGDTPINVKLRAVSFRKVLDLLLSEASSGSGLAFYVDEGVIEITTKEISDGQMFTVVYPVEDLLVEAPEFSQPPDFSISSKTAGGSNGGGGGRGGSSNNNSNNNNGGGLFGGSSRGSSGSSSTTGKDKQAKGDELVQLVVDTVQPTAWQQNGGKATIKFWNGNLIVTAPRSIHEQIGGSID